MRQPTPLSARIAVVLILLVGLAASVWAFFETRAHNRQRAEDEALQWLAFTGLTERAHALPQDLNLHQRKFLEFARALASRPKVARLNDRNLG